MLPFRFCCCSILFVITWMCMHVLPSQAVRRVEFTATNYTFNPKYFKNFTLAIRSGNMNMNMELLRPIKRGFKTSVEYQERMANAKTFQTLFSQIVDVCAMLSNVKGGLFKSWFLSMTKNGNLMQNCPIEPGIYYLRDWKMAASMTHQFLYPGEYRGKVKFFYGKYKSKTENRVLSLNIDSILYN